MGETRLHRMAREAAHKIEADPYGVSDAVADEVCGELGCRASCMGAPRYIMEALDAEREAERVALRAIVQTKLDTIVSGLDMCSWGDDEAWQIQCHMDDLVEIINAAGGSAGRVMFMPDPLPTSSASGTEAAWSPESPSEPTTETA